MPQARVGEQQHGQQHESRADEPASAPGLDPRDDGCHPRADHRGHGRRGQHEHAGAVADHPATGHVRGEPAHGVRQPPT